MMFILTLHERKVVISNLHYHFHGHSIIAVCDSKSLEK